MAQTAVDWLVNKIYMVIPNEERNFLEGLKEQAKAMEKERVVNFCFECLRGDNIHTIKSNKELLEYIEQYYNEQYGK